MNENLPIHRVPPKVGVFQLVCWKCRENIELPVTKQPYACPICHALLIVRWRSLR
jgi:hypothetical protein